MINRNFSNCESGVTEQLIETPLAKYQIKTQVVEK